MKLRLAVAMQRYDTPDSAKGEGSSIVDEPERAEPLCARITGANREVSEGKADVGPRSFSFTRATRSREGARLVRLFQGCTGLWTAGCWLARWLHQLKASTTMDLGISIFLIFVRCMALRNLDLFIESDSSVVYSLCC